MGFDRSEAAFDATSPLRLAAMTLRGIGSYARGARLEVRPLTALCGTNGSGKSTWIKTLRMLRDSCRHPLFPFVLSYRDDLHVYRGFFNTHVAVTGVALDGDTGENRLRFGVNGSIGVEIDVVKDLQLSFAGQSAPMLPDSDSRAARFLLLGLAASGSSIRIRVSHVPGEVWSIDDEILPTRYFREEVELALDGVPLATFSRKAGESTYLFSCDTGLLEGSPSGGVVPCGIVGLNDTKTSLVVQGLQTTPPWLESIPLCQMVHERIRAVVRQAMDGTFLLGAIRTIAETPSALPPGSQDSSHCTEPLQSRHVGESGERTTMLLKEFRSNVITDALLPHSGSFSATYSSPPVIEGDLLNLLSSIAEGHDEQLRRIFPPDSITHKSLAAGYVIKRGLPREVEDRQLEKLLELDGTLLVLDLNSAVVRDDLYSKDVWPVLPRLAAAVRRHGSGRIHAEDRAYFNRCLIDATLSRVLKKTIASPALRFASYYGYWLSGLAGIHIEGRDWPEGLNQNLPVIPVLDNFVADEAVTADGSDEANFFFGPFFDPDLGPPTSPPVFSSGFHQVHPMVVQLGLMRPGETMCVENPEVHLHPKSQLDVTELLIRHAMAGRQVIVETHSDLVVRRVIRAILEEDLPQAAASLYFTRVGRFAVGMAVASTEFEPGDGKTYPSSVLESLTVDARGRIANWPEGFMDVDVLESRRLLDIMYPVGGDEGTEE